MGPADQTQLVDPVKFTHHSGPKLPACSAVRADPGLDVLGVGPHEVLERAFHGDLLASVDGPDLVDSVDERGQTCVHTEDRSFNEGGNPKVVEHLSAVLPDIRISVLLHDFIVEAVH